MKTVKTELYSFKELSPEAQSHVLAQRAEEIQSDPDNFTLSEAMDSLKAIVAACGEKLSDWSVGPYVSHNYARVRHDAEWDGGHQTQAHFLRVLLAHGYTRPARFADLQTPGICGFTGVCFDEDLVEAMWQCLLEGGSLSDAADRAADRIQSICEDDLDYRTSRAGILEYLEQEEEIYLETGDKF